MTCYGKRQLVAAVIVAVFLAGMQVAAQEQSATVEDAMTALSQKPITVHAKSSVLMEANSGQILVASNKDEKIPPASFAKLLTLYVVFDMLHKGKISLSDDVYISRKAWQTGGSKMFVALDTKVPLEELIKGIAVVSGNDACVAIAEHLYGSTEAFVQVMNETAQRLGMHNSHFANPHGLPSEDQYTTAEDMAILARRYISDFPEVLQYHSLQEYTYGDIHQANRNRLLRKDPTVDGLKTGYIEEAGYHLLATAKRDERRLIAVVMGTERPIIREEEALKLLNYGFRNFSFITLFTPGEVLHTLRVWKGKAGTLPVVAKESGLLVIPEEYKNKVVQEDILPDHLTAPIIQDHEIGKRLVKVDNHVIRAIPLLASVDIERAGLIKILYHNIYLSIRGKTIIYVALGLVAISMVIALISLLKRRRRRRRVQIRW